MLFAQLTFKQDTLTKNGLGNLLRLLVRTIREHSQSGKIKETNIDDIVNMEWKKVNVSK
ncbi:hypothetical protein GCM10008933_19840 [Paenibacillus motobuensis]|uniref:Uncharacterized protein n=1 Tax=Paenibacillus motobuensis TaxID=295324 RepID=A0ABN0YAC3_9BACL